MSYTKKEKEYYNTQREHACQRLGITKNEYNWFRRYGARLHKLYEFQCNGCDDNGYSSEATVARWDKWETEFMDKAEKKAEKLELFIFFQTDPRGATVYLDIQPIPANNYTQAVCIY
jgi:hypothetical protein